MSLKIEVKKKDLTWLIPLVVVLVIGVVYVYNSGASPSVMGHSWGEVECNDCIGASDIAANAVGDSEMIDNPSFSSITLGGVSKNSWSESSSDLHYITNRHSSTGSCSNWCSTLGLTCTTGHNAGAWGSATVSCGSWALVCVCSE